MQTGITLLYLLSCRLRSCTSCIKFFILLKTRFYAKTFQNNKQDMKDRKRQGYAGY